MAAAAPPSKSSLKLEKRGSRKTPRDSDRIFSNSSVTSPAAIKSTQQQQQQPMSLAESSVPSSTVDTSVHRQHSSTPHHRSVHNTPHAHANTTHASSASKKGSKKNRRNDE
ncbi:unnamed protein product [Anisakis simplex]|uniref:Uncharacterized protein n=1 Tax=Anisakis simplex TaxID=6269 RepID=A0A3P6P540_ANISI|nr:unnamed protein product [Anisakis simplex]